MELKENERIDDLELNNLKIIQNKNGFCFGWIVCCFLILQKVSKQMQKLLI